jgi:hypothetical protein
MERLVVYLSVVLLSMRERRECQEGDSASDARDMVHYLVLQRN